MYLYIKKENAVFRETLVSVILTFYIGYIGYVFFPAVGPKFTMSHMFETSLTGTEITDRLSFLMNYEISEYTRRDCFPSLHNGIIFLILLFAFKQSRTYAFLFLPFAISLFISTLYLRYHYFIDMVAGFALALIVFYFGPRLKSFLMKSGADEAVAEEIIQETMTIIWTKADYYDSSVASPSTWTVSYTHLTLPTKA